MILNRQIESQFMTSSKRTIPLNGLENQFCHLEIQDKRSVNSKKQETDDKLLMEILMENNRINSAQQVATHRTDNQGIRYGNFDSKKVSETGYETEDFEESKLIEDLFFIK